MRCALLVIVAGAVGCGHTPMGTPLLEPEPPAVTELPLRQACFLWGMGTVFSEFDFSCVAMECNREVAIRILTERKILAAREDFAVNFRKTPVLLRAVARLHTVQPGEPDYNPKQEQWIAGRYHSSFNGDGYIEMERTGWPLLHELLHVLDEKRGRFGHTGWDERGYTVASEDFVLQMTPLQATKCSP